MRGPGRPAGDLLLDAQEPREALRPRSDNRRRGRHMARQPRGARRAPHQDAPGRQGDDRLETQDKARDGGGGPGQLVREAELQAAAVQGERRPGRQPDRPAFRRIRAQDPCRLGPHVRSRGRQMELRMPPGRPLQPRDRRPRRGRAEDVRPGQVGFRDVEVPAFRHRGAVYGQGRRVRKRGDRRDARGLRHRAVAVEEGLPPTTTRSSNHATRP